MIAISGDHLLNSQHANRTSKAGQFEKQIALQSFLENNDLDTENAAGERIRLQNISKRDNLSSNRDSLRSLNELGMDNDLTKKIRKLQKSESDNKDASLKTNEVNYKLLPFPESAIKENLDIVMPRNRILGKPNRVIVKPISLPQIRCTVETKKAFQVMQGSNKAEILKKISGSKSFWGEVPNLPQDSSHLSKSKLPPTRAIQVALEKPKDRVPLQKVSQAVVEEPRVRSKTGDFPFSMYVEKKRLFEEKNKDYLNRNFEKLVLKKTDHNGLATQSTGTRTLPQLQLRRSTNKELGTIKINNKANLENVAQLMAAENVEWYLPALANKKSLKKVRPSVATVDRFNVRYVFGEKGYLS